MLMILDEGGGYCSPCNTIWKTVDKLPSLDMASRNHAYILPDNSVWILNHDGTEFITAQNKTVDVSSKQDKLTAGSGITIENNVISVTNANIKRYLISDGSNSTTTPWLVMTVEEVELNDIVLDKVTLDLVLPDAYDTGESFGIAVDKKVAYYIKAINLQYHRLNICGANITVDTNGTNILIIGGITNANAYQAGSATFYVGEIDWIE